MANGEWRMANGEWRMANGEWRMANGKSRAMTTDSMPPSISPVEASDPHMALPSIRSIRAWFRDFSTMLRRDGRDWTNNLADGIDTSVAQTTSWRGLPLFLMALYHRSHERSLVLLESLAAMRSHSPWSDLLSKKKVDNTVYGDFFEAFVGHTLTSTTGDPIRLAVEQPSGRNYDFEVTAHGSRIAIETSVVGESVIDKAKWDTLHEKRRRWKKTFIKSQPYTGNAYENIIRVTTKALDKVAKNCNPAACQLSEDKPNLLFLGMPSLSTRPWDRDVSWALDGLFSEAPWERQLHSSVIADVWSVLEIAVIKSKAADPNDPQSFDDFLKLKLWDRFKLISGVLLFSECRFVEARINYHAHPKCLITHGAMAQIEEAMANGDWRAFSMQPNL